MEYISSKNLKFVGDYSQALDLVWVPVYAGLWNIYQR